MEKVKCEKCGKLTVKASNCMYCGASLLPGKESPLDNAFTAASQRDDIATAQQQSIAIARLSVFEQLPDGSFPGLKRLTVQSGTRTIVYAEGLEPMTLLPGQYHIAKSGPGTSSVGAYLAQIRSGVAGIINVLDAPFPAQFALPDTKSLIVNNRPFDAKGVYQALSLRTADNLLGGVEIQLNLRCLDVLAFLRNMLLSDPVFGKWKEEQEAEQQRTGKKGETGGIHILGYPFALVRRLILGGGAGARGEDKPFTVHDLYTRIRNEFALAVRTTIRNETAESLYDNIEVRDRVAQDIKRVMEKTLVLYGIEIDQIVAFQFSSPEYEDLLSRRGQIAIERQELQDRREKADIDKQKRDLTADDARHLRSAEGTVERHDVTEAAETDKVKDEAAAEDQKRHIALHAQHKQHERDQAALDERQRTQLQFEKAQMALQLQNQMKDAEVQRRIQLLLTYAQLPKDSILTIALSENPQLAAAYVAATQAQGLQQQIAMQDQFRQQLTQALGHDRNLVNTLMVEAVKQLGNVLSKKAEAQRPQILATGTSKVLEIEAAPVPTDAKTEGQSDKNGETK